MSKDTIHVSQFRQMNSKQPKKSTSQKKVQSAKELMQLDTTAADEALEAVQINAKAEHVEYGKGKDYHEFTLKSTGKVWRVQVKPVTDQS